MDFAAAEAIVVRQTVHDIVDIGALVGVPVAVASARYSAGNVVAVTAFVGDVVAAAAAVDAVAAAVDDDYAADNDVAVASVGIAFDCALVVVVASMADNGSITLALKG